MYVSKEPEIDKQLQVFKKLSYIFVLELIFSENEDIFPTHLESVFTSLAGNREYTFSTNRVRFMRQRICTP